MGNPVPSHTPDIFAWSDLRVAFLSSILVRDLPKSPKDMLVVEFTDLEIGGAAERYRTSVTKYLPKPLRILYRGGRARAVNWFTSGNAAINEIEGQSHERSDLCHRRCSSTPAGNSRFRIARRREDSEIASRSLTAAGIITIWNLMAARSDVHRAPYGIAPRKTGA
jgi:hypothetical protein